MADSVRHHKPKPVAPNEKMCSHILLHTHTFYTHIFYTHIFSPTTLPHLPCCAITTTGHPLHCAQWQINKAQPPWPWHAAAATAAATLCGGDNNICCATACCGCSCDW